MHTIEELLSRLRDRSVDPVGTREAAEALGEMAVDGVDLGPHLEALSDELARSTGVSILAGLATAVLVTLLREGDLDELEAHIRASSYPVFPISAAIQGAEQAGLDAGLFLERLCDLFVSDELSIRGLFEKWIGQRHDRLSRATSWLTRDRATRRYIVDLARPHKTLPPDVVAALIGLFDHEVVYVRRDALRRLEVASLSADQTAAVAECLTDPDDDVRSFASFRLCEATDRGAGQAEAMQSCQDPHVRRGVAWWLMAETRIGDRDPQGPRSLLSLLQDPDDDVFTSAMAAFSRYRELLTAAQLAPFRALAQSVPPHRRPAIRELLELGDHEPGCAVCALLPGDGGDPFAHDRDRTALTRLSPPVTPPSTQRQGSGESLHRCAECGRFYLFRFSIWWTTMRPIEDHHLHRLAIDDAEKKALKLEFRGFPHDVSSAMVRARSNLDHPTRWVRTHAARTLAVRGVKDSDEAALVALLKLPDPAVIVEVLDRIPRDTSGSVFDAIDALISHPDLNVRRRTAQWLISAGHPWRPDLLASTDVVVLQTVLRGAPPDEVIPRVMALAEDKDSRVASPAWSCISALARDGRLGPYVPWVVQWLGHADDQTSDRRLRVDALRALGGAADAGTDVSSCLDQVADLLATHGMGDAVLLGAAKHGTDLSPFSDAIARAIHDDGSRNGIVELARVAARNVADPGVLLPAFASAINQKWGDTWAREIRTLVQDEKIDITTIVEEMRRLATGRGSLYRRESAVHALVWQTTLDGDWGRVFEFLEWSPRSVQRDLVGSALSAINDVGQAGVVVPPDLIRTVAPYAALGKEEWIVRDGAMRVLRSQAELDNVAILEVVDGLPQNKWLDPVREAAARLRGNPE